MAEAALEPIEDAASGSKNRSLFTNENLPASSVFLDINLDPQAKALRLTELLQLYLTEFDSDKKFELVTDEFFLQQVAEIISSPSTSDNDDLKQAALKIASQLYTDYNISNDGLSQAYVNFGNDRSNEMKVVLPLMAAEPTLPWDKNRLQENLEYALSLPEDDPMFPCGFSLLSNRLDLVDEPNSDYEVKIAHYLNSKNDQIVSAVSLCLYKYLGYNPEDRPKCRITKYPEFKSGLIQCLQSTTHRNLGVWVMKVVSYHNNIGHMADFCDAALLRILIDVYKERSDVAGFLYIFFNFVNNVGMHQVILDPSIGFLDILLVGYHEGQESVAYLKTISQFGMSEEGADALLKSGVIQELIAILRAAPQDPAEWTGETETLALTGLKKVAEWESCRQRMRDVGALEVFGPLLNYDHPSSLNGVLSVAYLVGREEQGKYAEMLRKGVTGMGRFIDCLESSVQNVLLFNFRWRRLGVVKACLELSFSDANKVMLAIPRVRDLLIRMMSDAPTSVEVADSYNSSKDIEITGYLAIEALLQLSFVVESNEELIAAGGFMEESCNIKQCLLQFIEHFHVDIANSPSGVLLSRLTVTKKPNKEKKDVEHKDSHIMLSYCWNKKAKPELVEKLYQALCRRGYEVWRDIEGSALVAPMSGSVDERMAEAIERSHAVVVCVSKEYKQSSNCRIEANYANARLKKGKLKIFYVMLQEEYTTASEPESVDGYLGVMVGDAMWYSLFDASMVDVSADGLASMVGNNALRVNDAIRNIPQASATAFEHEQSAVIYPNNTPLTTKNDGTHTMESMSQIFQTDLNGAKIQSIDTRVGNLEMAMASMEVKMDKLLLLLGKVDAKLDSASSISGKSGRFLC